MLFDFEVLPGRDRYKLVTNTIVPRPIAWVVTLDEVGRTNAAPFSFFNVFPDDPVVVGIGIGSHASGRKDTAANIARGGQFTVALVSEATAAAMNVTAIEFAPEVDELTEAGLTTLPSARVAPPRIAESPVALECVVFETVPIGHHGLVLGRVRAMRLRDDCVLDAGRCRVDTSRLGLIGRMQSPGRYVRTTDTFEMARIAPAEWAARKKV